MSKSTPSKPNYLQPARPAGKPSRLPEPKRVHIEPFEKVEPAHEPSFPKAPHR